MTEFNPLREEGEFSLEKTIDEIKNELGSLATRKTYLLGLLEHYESLTQGELARLDEVAVESLVKQVPRHGGWSWGYE